MMKEATPTKGFITIATGKPYYYQLAANLVQSYRYHTKQAMPFAILAEEENEYTALFDDVVVVKDAKRTFMDKFLLFELCPYDETIFIDADSLCYGDLNAYWDLFKDATDFSAVGGILDKEEMGGAIMISQTLGNMPIACPTKYGYMPVCVSFANRPN